MAHADEAKTIEFIKTFAGITLSKMERAFENYIAFKLPQDSDLRPIRMKLTESLGVPEDAWHDHHGDEFAWDIETDKKRVWLKQRFDGSTSIGLVNWD